MSAVAAALSTTAQRQKGVGEGVGVRVMGGTC